MFRTQQNPFDDVVAKATDENLTSENWEYMMDAWEQVNSSGDSGPKEAVAALIKRLAHRNANVQLYTLELAYAFSQNCGPKMNRELASRSFTDALLRMAGDRNTHQTVKAKVLEKMGEWTEMFSNEPDLGIMEQAYNRLKSQNPNIHAPSKPNKREITDLDRQKEEEELQMALAISLKEKPGQPQASSSSSGSKLAASSQGQTQAPQAEPTPVPHTTAATVSRVRALYDFVPSESGELAFRKGDVIAVLESVYKDWWKGSLRGQTGIFPLNYVEKLSDPTPEELEREAHMESEVFGQIKNVEKLLALLSTSSADSSVQDSEEITTLYHSTLAIRPKLIELIGKYSQKKDDFMALNERFIKARRDYESLLESSMSHTHYGGMPPSQATYGYPPNDGYPPGGNPGRYYTPGPQHNPSASPPAGHGAYPPPQQKPAYGSRTSQYYPSQPEGSEAGHHGGAPFYVVGNAPPGTKLPGRAGTVPPGDYPPSQQPSQPPTGPAADGPSQPQELATSIYDTPIETRPPNGASFNPPTSNPNPAGSDRARSPSQPPGQAPYPVGYHSYQPPQPVAASSQPPYQDPSGPSPISPPNAPAHPYPALNTSTGSAPSPGPAYHHQTYAPPGQRPASYYGHEAPQAAAPQDYYRHSEMFLPPGSRAQS